MREKLKKKKKKEKHLKCLKPQAFDPYTRGSLFKEIQTTKEKNNTMNSKTIL